MTKLEEARRAAKKTLGINCGQSYCEKRSFGWSWKVGNWSQEQAIKAAELLEKEGYKVRVVETRSEIVTQRDNVRWDVGNNWRVWIYE